MLRPADSLAPHKELRCHRALAWISPPVAGQLPSVLALTRVGLSPTSTLHLSGHAVTKKACQFSDKLFFLFKANAFANRFCCS
jgi:hypothetical protein